MEDFVGFRFGNVHTEDLHLIVVSSSNRYEKNLLPEHNDYHSKITGGDGEYYFGQTFNARNFSISVAFDNVSEENFRQISQTFATDKLQDLVFDELPYKTYKAKLNGKPEFKFVCFKDKETNKRIYKGEGTLKFICYDPYAFGFNKYLVRAADYYKCLPPEEIIKNTDYYDNKPYQYKKILPGLIKEHYNVKNNMNTPWKGGYPSIEQVQNGELYFIDPINNEKKLLIDVRGYWDNIPRWQSTAKLLTSPTLDFEQELIFMPQYSKFDYYNMDIGLNQQNGIIGSRLLVYNPGDIPIEFELKLGNLSNSIRNLSEDYVFRISRYNVQRLRIDQAVDWTGLKTLNKAEDKEYRYGTHYFKILENKNNEYSPHLRNLKESHPKHTYMVEPIPREKLGYFIRLFYWQTQQINGSGIPGYDGNKIADRYEELYKLCKSDDERYELYWKTLKDGILNQYGGLDGLLKEVGAGDYTFEDNDENKDENKDEDKDWKFTKDDFIENYIQNPPEYIRTNKDLKYGQFMLNAFCMPQYYTFDYFDISTKDMDRYEQQGIHKTIKPLVLDSKRRMLYNNIIPKPTSIYDDSFFDFKDKKNILNENIEKGHWFTLPPGWSLIDVSPVVDEDNWGGKRWLDARPFQWGSHNKNNKEKFEKIYKDVIDLFIKSECPDFVLKRYKVERDQINNLSISEKEELIQFRKWYTAGISDDEYYSILSEKELFSTSNLSTVDLAKKIKYESRRSMTEAAEYKFLRLLASYWKLISLATKTNINVSDWWWDANNYIWANFPPLYWGYADLLNKAQIDYIPLFY